MEPADSFAPAAGMKVGLTRSGGSKAMFFSTLYIMPVVLIVTLVLITASVKILREYERAVVFTLGRFQAVKGPGLILMIPFAAGNGQGRFAHPGDRDTEPGRDLP